MKFKHIITVFIVSISVIMVTVSVSPSNNFVLIPPLCFTDEMYSSQDVSPNDIITNNDVQVKVRFKIFDIIKGFINNLFNKQANLDLSSNNNDIENVDKTRGISEYNSEIPLLFFIINLLAYSSRLSAV